ncbi:MAG TPA: hypothetical protein DCR44_04510 [Acholeplasmatales bacterium]|nr:hypothetical protein [Acholeplasmatales bacterium]
MPLQELLPLLIPLIVVQLTMQVVALINLKHKTKVRFGNKLVWVLIIVFGTMLGSILYFILGGVADEDGGND